jgi:hypothetical protein
VLADIRALGIRVLSDLPSAVLRDQMPADIAEAHLATDPVVPRTEQAADRPGFMAPPRAADAAVAVTMALGILSTTFRNGRTSSPPWTGSPTTSTPTAPPSTTAGADS